MEQDILTLHLDLRKSQNDVAKILGVSQPTINYRYKRSRLRLSFMAQLPPVTSEEVRQVLHHLKARDQDIEALALYVETNSQSEVARRMSTSQGAVRHWIHRAMHNHLNRATDLDDTIQRVRMACTLLVNHPGMFSEPWKTDSDIRHNEHHLQVMPKVQGRYLVGETLMILDGLYASLEVEVTKNDKIMETILKLRSQVTTITWPMD